MADLDWPDMAFPPINLWNAPNTNIKEKNMQVEVTKEILESLLGICIQYENDLNRLRSRLDVFQESDGYNTMQGYLIEVSNELNQVFQWLKRNLNNG